MQIKKSKQKYNIQNITQWDELYDTHRLKKNNNIKKKGIKYNYAKIPKNSSINEFLKIW